MIILFQKQINHEPDQWEDITIPDWSMEVRDLINKFHNLEMEGTYKIIDDVGCGIAPLTKHFKIYRAEIVKLSIDGIVQDD